MHARTLITLAAITVLAALARGQDALALARTARIDPGRPVVLADIARLTGPAAEQLGALVLIETPDTEPADGRGWFRVDLDRVRARLVEELGEGAGMVALSGSVCDVQVFTPTPAPTGAANRPEPPAATPDARELIGLATVRGALAREVSRLLQTAPQSLRLAFEAGDAAFLDMEATGRVIEISPVGASERMPLAVAVYDPSGHVTRRTVRIGIEVQRSVALAARVVPRGKALEAADLSPEVRWVSPTDRVVGFAEAVGSVARQRLDPGETLETHLVEPPVMINKGDLVFVRVVTAGLVVRREANALSDGRQGETIEFAARHDATQRFRAMVAGRGDAMVWAGRAPAGSGTGLAMTSDAGG